jgi:hypothetical protein
MPTPIDWHHPRTALAEQYLRMFVVVGAPSLVLFAPRGYGKTQFVTRDLIPAATAAGMAPIYINFWEDNTRPAASVVAALLHALHTRPGIAQSLKQEARRLAGDIGLSLDAQLPGLGKATASAKLSRAAKPDDTPADPLLLMHRLTERLAKALGQTLLFVFDEVQTLAAKPEHETFVRSLRTLLDSQRHHVCSVFTGSSQSKLAEMFQRIRAPLYNFSRNDVLPPLGDDFLTLWLKNIGSLIGPDHGLTPAHLLFGRDRHGDARQQRDRALYPGRGGRCAIQFRRDPAPAQPDPAGPRGADRHHSPRTAHTARRDRTRGAFWPVLAALAPADGPGAGHHAHATTGAEFAAAAVQ